MMMKTNGHGIIYNNKVFFVQPMELPCDDTKKFSLESVPEKKPYPLCFHENFHEINFTKIFTIGT